MEVQFVPETEAKLNRLAAERGREPQSLVHEAVERFLDYDEWFIREVEKGLEQIEAGETLEEDEVARRLETLIAQRQHQN